MIFQKSQKCEKSLFLEVLWQPGKQCESVFFLFYDSWSFIVYLLRKHSFIFNLFFFFSVLNIFQGVSLGKQHMLRLT